MLSPQRAITWRRKWLRWRRQLQRYNFSTLVAAVFLGLVLVVVLFRFMSTEDNLGEWRLLPVRPVVPILVSVSPRPVVAADIQPDSNPREANPVPELVSAPELRQLYLPVTSVMSQPASLSLDAKRQAVSDAVLHAWTGYKKNAFGHDELLPLSKTFTDNWGSLAWTLIDSLGVLYLTGLTDEFQIARNFIANMNFDQIDSDVSVFETNIRILGGLVSAFELSGDYMFIVQAKKVGDALMPAFETASGLPASKVNLVSGRQSGGWLGVETGILSEFGSLQLEFSTLSHLTGDPKYMSAAMKVYDVLNQTTSGGLLPTEFSLISGRPSNNVLTIGALSDSYYEYLLKLYILSDRTLPAALNMYIKAIDEMFEKLIIEWEDPQSKKKRARIIIRTNGVVENKMEHLACFVPGMLALGAHYGELHNIESLLKRKEQHMDMATKLMDTCMEMYTMTKTQLPAEHVIFSNGKPAIGDDPRYLLRPETVESLFVLHRITQNEAYRDAGWNIFSAIEKHCKTDTAYAAVQHVDSSENPAPKIDNMESFVMAETFKYLYLLFSPSTFIPLDHFVFTTEAHPLRIMKGSTIQFSV